MTKMDSLTARELFDAGETHGLALERYINAVMSGDSAAIDRELNKMKNARDRFHAAIDGSLRETL